MTNEPNRNPTVFIVDDESAVRDALCLVVETMGHSVQCFSSASEFLEFIRSHDIADRVCLIADIQMPETSGIELLEQLNGLDKKFPVIIITGHAGAALKHMAEILGAVAFLEKPFRPAQLQEAIAKTLR